MISGEDALPFLATVLATVVLARFDLTLPCLSWYRRGLSACRCRIAARSGFAGPPRALTRWSSAGSDAVRYTATARASRRRSALWLGGTALERFGVSPMNISAGSVLLRAPKALARICP